MVAKPLCPLYKNIIKPLDRARYPELRYNMDINIEKADYIYLSEIDLNYSLPKSLFSGKKWIRSIDVFGKLENVGLIWTANSKHYHPQYLPGSWEPQLTFTLGANVKF